MYFVPKYPRIDFNKSLLGYLKLCLALVVTLAFSACGGGGGGGDGGGGRTTKTALRLIHASIDGSPLEVKLGDVVVQKARFAEVTAYAAVEQGPSLVEVGRVNSTGVLLGRIPLTLEKETEYTLFVVGAARDSQETVVVLEEPVARPERGFARVQLLNGLIGATSLRGEIGGVSLGPVLLGASSGFVDVASGAENLIVRGASSQELLQVALLLEDRAEATVLVTGSQELGIRISRIYPDLD